MLRTMTRKDLAKPTIAIVGAGSLGSALAVALRAAGYPLSEIVSRAGDASRRRARYLARRVGARATVLGQGEIRASIVWLCVPDREIRGCAESLARTKNWSARIVLHSSGALGSEELRALRRWGAAVASLHPLMTFVPGIAPSLRGVPFAVEGDPAAERVARQVARDLGGATFVIHERDKAAYHAWGAFASPLLLAALVTAERVAGAAGIPPTAARTMMLPIIRQTLANYAEHGPEGAFSGPIIRGDAATLEKHLRILRRVPEAREVYLALARSAVRNLPGKNKKQLRKMLA
jgi:predicted short-subunit dehydrogenase-like oxidoreductase (DUF2520 family)